ncbi:MAG: nitrilase, partial [Bacteroidetes bacterium]
MNDLKIATAQFEHKSGDKNYNLSVIEKLAADAASKGVQVIAFHECSVTGYSFARHLDRDQLFEITEPIPNGPSVKKLIEIAKKYGITVLAGLFERDGDNKIFKAQVCVNEGGLIAKFRKIHPFINPNILPGT